MAVRDIAIYGNPILRREAESVEALTPELEALVDDMAETMYTTKGIGLAANQVSVPVRLIVVDVDQLESDDSEQPKPRRLQVYYNPEVVEESREDSPMSEGCLSVPGLEGEVYRPKAIRFRARDERFEPVEFDAEGMLARVLQHEIDHTNGVLFVDRLSRIKRIALAGRLARLRKRGAAQGRPADQAATKGDGG
jgi:peptide deformylase